MMVTGEHFYFHDFVKNVPGFVEKGKKTGEPLSDIIYYFHTYYQPDGDDASNIEPGDGCKEKSRVHFIGFSPEKDGVFDQRACRRVRVEKAGKRCYNDKRGDAIPRVRVSRVHETAIR
jgi:hypothetical protein